MNKTPKTEKEVRTAVLALAKTVTEESRKITAELTARRQEFNKEWDRWGKPRSPKKLV